MKINPKLHLKLKLKFAILILLTGVALTALALPAVAQDVDTLRVETDNELLVKSAPTGIKVEENNPDEDFTPPEAPALNGNPMGLDTLFTISGRPHTIYGRPASWTYSEPWWHGMWINTAVYAGAFIGTLFVLECLPEDATSWNRAELRQDPVWKRW